MTEIDLGWITHLPFAAAYERFALGQLEACSVGCDQTCHGSITSSCRACGWCQAHDVRAAGGSARIDERGGFVQDFFVRVRRGYAQRDDDAAVETSSKLCIDAECCVVAQAQSVEVLDNQRRYVEPQRQLSTQAAASALPAVQVDGALDQRAAGLHVGDRREIQVQPRAQPLQKLRRRQARVDQQVGVVDGLLDGVEGGLKDEQETSQELVGAIVAGEELD